MVSIACNTRNWGKHMSCKHCNCCHLLIFAFAGKINRFLTTSPVSSIWHWRWCSSVSFEQCHSWGRIWDAFHGKCHWKTIFYACEISTHILTLQFASGGVKRLESTIMSCSIKCRPEVLYKEAQIPPRFFKWPRVLDVSSAWNKICYAIMRNLLL